MVKHLTYIEDYKGSIEDIAKDVFNLRFDYLAHFSHCFGNALLEAAESDSLNNKINLAYNLNMASSYQSLATSILTKIGSISKEHSHHPKIIPNYEQDIENLAHKIERLRYNKTMEFSKELTKNIETFIKEENEYYPMICNDLKQVVFYQDKVTKYLQQAWNICEKKM